jgi:serine/threonine protein kinase
MPFPASVFARSGKFSEITPIGRGAAGQVYAARDNLDRLVAVKEALPMQEGFDRIRAKFEKESRLQASLNHPNIVRVYHLEDDPQTRELYLVCEYASAGSLAEMLEQRGPLPQPEALTIAIDLCAALEETERQQIVHRDIKPSNILLTSDTQEQMTAKLSDFGIAQDRKLRRTTILPGTTHPGTPLYMAPEQADGTALLDTRTDIYALGMTLWEMLTGTDYKMLLRDTPRPDIRDYNAQANPDIGRIVQRATQPAPADRYQSPQELRADLELVRYGKRPVAAERAPQRRGSVPRPPMRPALIGAGLLLLLVGVVWGVVLLWGSVANSIAAVQPPQASEAQPPPVTTIIPMQPTVVVQPTLVPATTANREIVDILTNESLTHRWDFLGQAGQVITITAEAPENIPASAIRSVWADAPLVPARSADPRLRLLGPDGAELAFNDDARHSVDNPVDAQIAAFELPADGTYTIMVDALVPGTYVLSVTAHSTRSAAAGNRDLPDTIALVTPRSGAPVRVWADTAQVSGTGQNSSLYFGSGQGSREVPFATIQQFQVMPADSPQHVRIQATLHDGTTVEGVEHMGLMYLEGHTLYGTFQLRMNEIDQVEFVPATEQDDPFQQPVFQPEIAHVHLRDGTQATLGVGTLQLSRAIGEVHLHNGMRIPFARIRRMDVGPDDGRGRVGVTLTLFDETQVQGTVDNLQLRGRQGAQGFEQPLADIERVVLEE